MVITLSVFVVYILKHGYIPEDAVNPSPSGILNGEDATNTRHEHQRNDEL